jgi:hypothetical protein
VARRLAIDAIRRHRFVGVRDDEDARADRYLLTSEALRITSPVEVLVMGKDDRHERTKRRRRLEDRRPVDRMPPHELLLIRVQSCGFHEDAVLDSDLADVVQEAGQLDLFDFSLRDAELAGDGTRDSRNAVGVATRESVLRVDRLRQRRYRPVKEVPGLGVAAKRVAREQQRDHE